MRKFGLLFPIVFAAVSMGCGKPQLKEFSPPDGNFTILMPGKPHREDKDMGGLHVTIYETAWRGEECGVGFVDLPAGNPGDLDGAVRGIYNGYEGTNLKSSGKSVNGDGYREFEFQSNKCGGYAAGRVVIARRRLYVFFAIGNNAQLSNSEVRTFIDSFQLTDGPTPGKEEANTPSSNEASKPSYKPSQSAGLELRPNPTHSEATVLSPTPSDPGSTSPTPSDPGKPEGIPNRPPPPNRAAQPQVVGNRGNPEFRDTAPVGSLLVGFDLGFGYFFNNDTIIAIRPIFRVGEKDQLGQIHGTDIRRAVRELAKPGYAVGAINVKAGAGIDGFYVTYMKIVGNQLDPNDTYHSSWLGGSGGGGPTLLGGDGTPVVGIVGHQNKKDLSAIGLQFGPTPTEALPPSDMPKPAPAPPKIPKHPRFIGGGFDDPEFRDEAPAGGLLVGFDIAPGDGGNSIATIRPIYRVKDKVKDVFGQMHGTLTKGGIKELAKPGYAIGAISIKGGLWVDGLSITYMKVVDDKLDPTDSYASTWYGAGGGNGSDAITLTGEGAPAIGVVGRQGRRDLSAFGLLFKNP